MRERRRTLAFGFAQRQAEVHSRDPLRLRDARVEVVEAVGRAEPANREPVQLVVEEEAVHVPAVEPRVSGEAREEDERE